MKIMIVTNCASGLEVFRGMLIRELIHQGHELSAIIPLVESDDEHVFENIIEDMGCNLIHVAMERRGMNPFRDLKLIIAYYHIFHTYRPQLVVTYTIKPNAYGGIAARLLRIPYAANITGLGTAFQRGKLLRFFASYLYKIALKKATVVFFENSDNLNRLLDAHIIQRNQAYLLHGAGVDLNVFTYTPYPLDSLGTRFLFIGRVMKEKGIEELFSAMQRLSNSGIPCSLDVLGNFDEDYSEIMEQYAADGWLHYHGFQRDVRPYIANCHCFVLPSWHEGMANTNLEAAASGRPVITSDIPGCREAVEDGVSGFLCKPKNAESLYQAMKRFLTLSQPQRQAMGQAGRKRMEAIFDKKTVVRDTIKELFS